MKNFILIILILLSSSILAESRQTHTSYLFLEKSNYLTDFKNNYEKIEYVCIGKVRIVNNLFHYFTCIKYFDKEKVYTDYRLRDDLKDYGLQNVPQPHGSLVIDMSKVTAEKKLQNEKMYFVFIENRRLFFIELEKAKKYIDFLANKKNSSIFPNPAQQICFKETDCISVEKTCTEQIAINKKYLNKHSVEKSEKADNKCNNGEVKINRPSCVENICTINNK